MISQRLIAARRSARAQWWQSVGEVLTQRAALQDRTAQALLAAWQTAVVASVAAIAAGAGYTPKALRPVWAALALPTPPSGAPVLVADLPAAAPAPEDLARVHRQRWRQSKR